MKPFVLIIRLMAKWKKLRHTVYQCSYHIVWCPKYRYRILKGDVAEFIEYRIRELCEWKAAEILELNVIEDHVHMVVIVPPKISLSEFKGILKGKIAISVLKAILLLKRSLNGATIFGAGVIVFLRLALMKRRYVDM